MAHSSCCSANRAAGEADDRSSGGEDAHDVGAASDSFVEPFLGVLDRIWQRFAVGDPVKASISSPGLVDVISCGVHT